MRRELQDALGQLRREIDILSASILARSRLAAPETLTSHVVPVEGIKVSVRSSEPPSETDLAPQIDVAPSPDPMAHPMPSVSSVKPVARVEILSKPRPEPLQPAPKNWQRSPLHPSLSTPVGKDERLVNYETTSGMGFLRRLFAFASPLLRTTAP